DGFVPFFSQSLARVHPEFRTPYVAIVVQSTIIGCLAATNGFVALAVLANVSVITLYLVCCAATIQLRRRDVRQAGVPFRMPGGRAVPYVAIAVLAWILWHSPVHQMLGVPVRHHCPVSPRRAAGAHAMNDSLLAYRAEFPIVDRVTYLVSNSLGAMPRAVPDRLAEYAASWNERGVRAWADRWWSMPLTVGDEIAPLLGAGPGEVAMFPNVTLAQAAVLSALDYTPPRDTIVMTGLDFPSVRYVYDQLAARLGARIVSVPSDDGIAIDVERVLAAIDERTCLVAVSHVLFRSAYILDVEAVCRRAHDAGALVSLDAFHSVGVMPVDVR